MSMIHSKIRNLSDQQQRHPRFRQTFFKVNIKELLPSNSPQRNIAQAFNKYSQNGQLSSLDDVETIDFQEKVRAKTSMNGIIEPLKSLQAIIIPRINKFDSNPLTLKIQSSFLEKNVDNTCGQFSNKPNRMMSKEPICLQDDLVNLDEYDQSYEYPQSGESTYKMRQKYNHSHKIQPMKSETKQFDFYNEKINELKQDSISIKKRQQIGKRVASKKQIPLQDESFNRDNLLSDTYFQHLSDTVETSLPYLKYEKKTPFQNKELAVSCDAADKSSHQFIFLSNEEKSPSNIADKNKRATQKQFFKQNKHGERSTTTATAMTTRQKMKNNIYFSNLINLTTIEDPFYKSKDSQSAMGRYFYGYEATAPADHHNHSQNQNTKKKDIIVSFPKQLNQAPQQNTLPIMGNLGNTSDKKDSLSPAMKAKQIFSGQDFEKKISTKNEFYNYLNNYNTEKEDILPQKVEVQPQQKVEVKPEKKAEPQRKNNFNFTHPQKEIYSIFANKSPLYVSSLINSTPVRERQNFSASLYPKKLAENNSSVCSIPQNDQISSPINLKLELQKSNKQNIKYKIKPRAFFQRGIYNHSIDTHLSTIQQDDYIISKKKQKMSSPLQPIYAFTKTIFDPNFP